MFEDPFAAKTTPPRDTESPTQRQRAASL